MIKGYFPIPHSLMHNKKLSKNDIWLYVIMCDKAEFAETMSHGIPVKRGQLLTTHKELSDMAGLTDKEERTSIKHLLENGYITAIDDVKIKDGVKGQRKLVTLLYDTKGDKECSIEAGLTGIEGDKAPQKGDKEGDKRGDKECRIETGLKAVKGDKEGDKEGDIIKNHNNLNNNDFDLMKTPEFEIFENSLICSKLTFSEKEKLLNEIGESDLRLVIAYLDNRKNPTPTHQTPFATITHYWRNGYVAGTSTQLPKQPTTVKNTVVQNVRDDDMYFNEPFTDKIIPRNKRLYVTQTEYVETVEEWRNGISFLRNSSNGSIIDVFSDIIGHNISVDDAERMLYSYADIRSKASSLEELHTKIKEIYQKITCK